MAPMQLQVKLMNGPDISLDADSDWDISFVKTKLQQQIPSRPSTTDMRLISQGRVMKDGTKISDYTSADTHLVHMVIRDPEPIPAPSASASAAAPAPAGPSPAEMPQVRVAGAAGPDLTSALSGLFGRFAESASQMAPNAEGRQQAHVHVQIPAHHHHHHHPHPHPHMPPAPQQQQQQQTSGIVQGIHVVVHATPADLDTLPDRLATFRREIQQMQPDAGPPVSLSGDPPQPTARAAPPQPATNPQDLLAGLGSAFGPLLQQVGQTLQSAGTTGATTTTTTTTTTSSAPPAAAAAAAPPAGTLFERIARESLGVLAVPDLMALAMSGSTAPLNKVEAVVVRHVQEALRGGATLDSLAADGAAAAVKEMLVDNREAAAQLRQACGAGTDAALADSEKIFRKHLRGVLDAVVNTPSRGGKPFDEAVVSRIGRGAGHWAERIRRRCANGTPDMEAVVRLVVQKQTQSYIGLLPPALAAMAPAVAPAGVGMGTAWVKKQHRAYSEAGTLEADDASAGLTPLEEPARPAGGGLSDADAQLLEDALASVPQAPAGGLSTEYTSGSL